MYKVHCIYLGVSGYYFKNIYCMFLFEDLFFAFTDSVDPAEMPHIYAFTVGKSTRLGFFF